MAEQTPSFSADVDWGPIRYMLAVTPNDDADLAADRHGYGPRGIYVGGAGNIVARFGNATNVTLTGLQAGVLYPLRPTRILDTGTTATAIVAGY